MRLPRSPFAAVALALAVAGCAPSIPDAFARPFAAGQRALSAGRYDEAARSFDAAAAHATRVKDRDEARYLEARAKQRSGRFDDARATYDRLIADSPTGPRAARADFDRAELEIDRGDAERGFSMLREAVLRHPNHGVARAAFTRLLRRERTAGGDARVVAWLDAVAPKLAKTELAQQIEYDRALALHGLGQKQEARDALVATAAAHPYPFGALTDDALFRASEIDEELGHYAEAVADLRKLLATRESADTMGSYERPRDPEAQLRLALLYRDRLGDHAAARRALDELVRDYPTSILRDDALFQAARLAHDDGDARDACSLVERLVKDFPDSRFARCGGALCPGAEPPKGARACPDYILREIGVKDAD
jgi:tetratricopeptide (TPR) repeat protein